MYSHYLHKTLGQSYYPTAEDFDYHVRQSIDMFNNCTSRKRLRACLYDSDLYKKMRVSLPLMYGFLCGVNSFSFLLYLFALCLVCPLLPVSLGLSILDCSFSFLWRLLKACTKFDHFSTNLYSSTIWYFIIMRSLPVDGILSKRNQRTLFLSLRLGQILFG